MGDVDHDDGDRRRRLLCRDGSRRCRCDQDVDLETDQLGRQEWEPLGFPVVRSVLDDDVLSVLVAQLPKPLLERLYE